MRRFRLFLLLTVAGLFFAQAVTADYLASKLKIPYGVVLTDTLKWHGSGAVPGSMAVKIDTIVAGTLNDTTRVLDVYGASQVSVTVLSRGKNDDCDFTITAQASVLSDTLGPWHSLLTTYSVDNTKGSQVGGVANTARDTTLWVLLSRATPDTASVLAKTGQTVAGHGDQEYVRQSRYLRFWIDPDASAGDTTYVTVISYVMYPPGP